MTARIRTHRPMINEHEGASLSGARQRLQGGAGGCEGAYELRDRSGRAIKTEQGAWFTILAAVVPMMRSMPL
jgi:hypothetical protein